MQLKYESMVRKINYILKHALEEPIAQLMEQQLSLLGSLSSWLEGPLYAVCSWWVHGLLGWEGPPLSGSFLVGSQLLCVVRAPLPGSFHNT
jgi:hypothetical protein